MNSYIPKIILVGSMLAVTAAGGNLGLARQNPSTAAIILATPSPATTSHEPFVLSSPRLAAEEEVPTIEEKIKNESVDDLLRRITDNGEVLSEESDIRPPLEPIVPLAHPIEQAALVPGEQSQAAIFHRTGPPSEPQVAIEAGLVADLESGELYYAKNLDKRWPIASITKLMTAYLGWSDATDEATVSFIESDFPLIDTSVAKKFRPGETYNVHDLVSAMLLASSNEAAEAIARYADRESFLARMNVQAVAWGMFNTHFADPTGLSSANQSTPNDLRLLVLNMYTERPEIFALTRKTTMRLTDTATGKRQTITNINPYAGQSGFLGGKTGYTDDARGNLLSLFSYRKRPVIVVVLGAADRVAETEKLYNWFTSNFELNR